MAFNSKFFINGTDENKQLQESTNAASAPTDLAVSQPKKPRKNKSTSATPKPVEGVVLPQTSMSYLQQNIPYGMAYEDSMKQLDETIRQLDYIAGETAADAAMVRASKTLRNKYGILPNMTENTISALNAKLSAIKEKNKVTADIMHLELQRTKELKLQQNEQDDTTRIADMYHAFINTPMGMGPGVLGPTIQDMTIMGQTQLPHMDIGMGNDGMWEQSLDPAQKRMLYDAQGRIETIVVYDETTGNRYFSVVDKQTRQPVQGIEAPSNANIYDLDINLRAGIAKDPNRNEIYPLVVVNSNNASINEY